MMTNVNQDALRQDFLQAMQRLAATVCVLTCRDKEDNKYGMAATSVTSLSMSPVSVVACVNRSSDFYRRISRAKAFCVNILAEGQKEQSRVFGSGQYRDERFQFGDWIDAPSAPPILADAQASLVCTTDASMNYGSHAIIVGLVEQVHLGQAPGPLIYFNRSFLATDKKDSQSKQAAAH